MSYRLIYTIPFASLRKETCVVEIEKEGYTGAPVELTGADSPFTVDIEDEEFLYTPTRFSTALIRIVGSDYLQTLFSTAYRQYRVTFKRSGVVTWCGFVKPEIYTQDYASDIFELEIECMSALSVLEYVNYKSEVEGKRKFVTLWDLVKKCVSSANGKYEAVYIPYVYASSSADYAAGTNVLESMTISEQNFYDEDDKAMTLKEVLEEICKFLNWTVCDWKGSLYFIDVDHEGGYFKYNLGLDSRTKVAINSLNIQRVGFAGGSQSYDGLNGYNKVTVKDSNYSINQVFPEENYGKLKQFSRIIETIVKNKVTVKQFFYPEIYRLFQYSRDGDRRELSNVELEQFRLNPNDILGAMPIKISNYNLVDGKPDVCNYKWENQIQVRRSFNTSLSQSGYLYLSEKKILSFRKPLPVSTYADGALILSFSIQITKNEDLTIDDDKRNCTPYVSCSVYIGDYYFNGKSWTKSEGLDIFRINVPFKDAAGFVPCENTKTLDMPYDDITGYVMPFPKGIVLTGEMKFDMYVLMPKGTEAIEWNKATKGYYIKDLTMEYSKRNDLPDLSENADRFYENVINGDYINELDEIEFKISSYNNDGACYSKVMLLDKYLTNNLYASIVGELIRPEELLIRRIVNRYDATRIKLTQEIQETADLTPVTRLSDNFMVNKIFINAGGSIDYKMGQFRCVMVEL